MESAAEAGVEAGGNSQDVRPLFFFMHRGDDLGQKAVNLVCADGRSLPGNKENQWKV